MEEKLNLRKVDGEVVIVTTIETESRLPIDELDRQILETEQRLETLKKTRKALCAFQDSTKQQDEVVVSAVVIEEAPKEVSEVKKEAK